MTKKNPTQGERLNRIEIGLARVEENVKWLKKVMMWLLGLSGSVVVALIINFVTGF